MTKKKTKKKKKKNKIFQIIRKFILNKFTKSHIPIYKKTNKN